MINSRSELIIVLSETTSHTGMLRRRLTFSERQPDQRDAEVNNVCAANVKRVLRAAEDKTSSLSLSELIIVSSKTTSRIKK
jgi:hypothetical protein